MVQWSSDPRLAAAQRRREAGPGIQAHADTNGIDPEETNDVDCALADLVNVHAFMKHPPAPQEGTKALEEQHGIVIRHPETDEELGNLSYEELLETRAAVILAEAVPAQLRTANRAGAIGLELVRDLAANRGDRETRVRASQLADALAQATADAAEFIEMNYPTKEAS